MSLSSGDLIVPGNNLHDTTIVTVHGSSTESAMAAADAANSGIREVEEMATDEADAPPGGSTGDLNTEDLEAFEKGMEKLQMTPESDKNPNVNPRTSEKYVNDKQQLFETCCFIENQLKSKFPVSPPKSCLMDQHTVSD